MTHLRQVIRDVRSFRAKTKEQQKKKDLVLLALENEERKEERSN